MQATRRYWTVAGAALVLLLMGVLVERPVLFVGATLIGAWLLARQYQFYRAVTAVDDALTIDLTVTPPRVATGTTTTVTLAATCPIATPLTATITAVPPVATAGSTASDRRCQLVEGRAETSFTITAPTAGAHTFNPARVTLTDAHGLFATTLARGPTPTVQVEPRAPRNVHVGTGGEEIDAAFGSHEAGALGTGIEPAEIRRYVSGDAADRIDWNATARLGELHVREFDAETNRETVLLLDHRSSLGTGPAGETALDYLREVALAFVDSASSLDDPLGLYTVGSEGLTGRWPSETSPGQYRELRRAVRAVTADESDLDAVQRSTASRSPMAARAAVTALDGQTTAFAQQLRPYYAAAEAYVQRIDDQPLYGTVQLRRTQQRGTVWTVILTDDSRRNEVLEAVELARRGTNHVLVFLTPQVLFEPGGLGQLDAAYDRYVDFEEFRQTLARLDRVEAFEVAPGDRLSAVLSATRAQREQRGGVR